MRVRAGKVAGMEHSRNFNYHFFASSSPFLRSFAIILLELPAASGIAHAYTCAPNEIMVEREERKTNN
jgi:hypothetical protein